jgi:hypothetical protein
MMRDKKSLGLIILVILILAILLIRLFILFAPNNIENHEDDSYIFKQSYSIYNGTDPDIIAENFAKALNESPIRSKHKERCCGTIIWKFGLQNDNHFSIETKKLKNNSSLLLDMRFDQSAYHEKNLSYDDEYAKEKVLNFSKEFLKMFNVTLGDNYTISVYSWHGNRSWRVHLYQIYNGKFINGTGFHAIVNRENGEIRSIDFGDWLDPNNIIEENISIDDGKIIIYNELKEDHFNISVPNIIIHNSDEFNTIIHESYEKNHTIPINTSDIEFIEYKALWGRLCYRYEIYFQINETKTCTYQYIIDVENGKILFWSSNSEIGSGSFGGGSKSYYNNLI